MASRGLRLWSRAAGQDENELLRLVASLEQGSEHPLGAAVVEAAKARGLGLERARQSSNRTQDVE